MKERLKKEIRAFIVGILGLSLIVLCSGVFSTIGHADSTQQYNKIFLNPYVRGSMLAATNYTYTITIDPPDNIASIKNAIINLNIYTTPTVNFTLWVNKESCKTPNFYISTTYGGAGLYSPSFDCSNVITKAGNYNITIRSTQSSSSSYAWLELTYMNNPQRKIEVHGTEYVPYQNGTVFIQVLDENQGIDDAVCDLSVFYPNKTFFIDDVMTFLNISNGLYYYDFDVPNVLGVYMLESTCNVPVVSRGVVKTFYGIISGDYHLLNASGSDGTYAFGTVGSGNEKCTEGFLDIPDQFGGEIRAISNITNMYVWLDTGGSSPATRIRINVSRQNTQTAQSTYITTLEANYTLSGTPTAYLMPNYNTLIILGQHDLLRLQVCIYKTGAGATYNFRYGSTYPSNFSRAIGGINISQVVQYRGSGEIHVSQNMWNYTNRTLTSFDFEINATATVNNTSIAETVWTNPTRTLTDLNFSVNATATVDYAAIWNYTSRTLTDYNSTGIFNLLTGIQNDILAINVTLPDAIWTATTRTLTEYNLTDIFNTILNTNSTLYNSLVAINNTLPSAVWQYNTRTLTDYNLTQIYELLGIVNITTTQTSGDIGDLNNTIIQINDTVNWINQSLVPNTIYIW